jgi:hypothetical protein
MFSNLSLCCSLNRRNWVWTNIKQLAKSEFSHKLLFNRFLNQRAYCNFITWTELWLHIKLCDFPEERRFFHKRRKENKFLPVPDDSVLCEISATSAKDFRRRTQLASEVYLHNFWLTLVENIAETKRHIAVSYRIILFWMPFSPEPCVFSSAV